MELLWTTPVHNCEREHCGTQTDGGQRLHGSSRHNGEYGIRQACCTLHERIGSKYGSEIPGAFRKNSSSMLVKKSNLKE
jgi:hypothetical protein